MLREFVIGRITLVAVVLGCAGDDGSQACVPGSTQTCSGPGSCSGAQSCLPNGSGYDSCDCGTGSGTGGSGGSSQMPAASEPTCDLGTIVGQYLVVHEEIDGDCVLPDRKVVRFNPLADFAPCVERGPTTISADRCELRAVIECPYNDTVVLRQNLELHQQDSTGAHLRGVMTMTSVSADELVFCSGSFLVDFNRI